MLLRLDNIKQAAEAAVEQRGKNATQTADAAHPALYDPHLKNRVAGNRLPEEMFARLPQEEFDRHVLAVGLIHDGSIRSGYLTRIGKRVQMSYIEANNRVTYLVQRGWMKREAYYVEKYAINRRVVLPIAMYILDRHPEWLAEELATIPQLSAVNMQFWHLCAALYDGEFEFLGRQANSTVWSIKGIDILVGEFMNPYYEPLLLTVSSNTLREVGVNVLETLVRLELLTDVQLQRVVQLVEKYGSSTAPDTYFEDYSAWLRYLLGGSLPLAQRDSSEWAYIAHAVSAMHHGEWKQAGQLFETAHKLRNKKVSKDKNLFYDTIANYYQMVYYAHAASEDARTKARQFLRKDVAKDASQLPARIVAQYVLLDEDDGNCSWYIEMMAHSGNPLQQSFARLLADYFQMEVGDMKPSTLPLLRNETLLASIHHKAPWERALEELMAVTDEPQPTPQTGKKTEERMAYVIEHFGDGRAIWPHKQKRTNSGGWSKPYHVSAQTYFTVGYDYMDDRDRQIFERLRKTVGHTKYYAHPNWGRLEDYLPYLMDTDKVLLKRSDYDYQPVTVRKERAYLTIEHKGKNLVFASNVQFNKKDLTLMSPCVVEESETSYVVVELSDYEKKVYGTLLRLGVMPAEAEQKLQAFIAAVSNHVEIHSDLIEGGSTLEKVSGNTTIVLRLAPARGVFTLECCVQPLTGGKLRFFPGQGKPTVFDGKDGTRYQVERNLAAEKERLLTLNEFAESHMSIVLTGEPQTVETEDVLMLMEFVQEHSEAFAIEWQEGGKLSVRQPMTKSYAMGLHSRENWFEVEGELQVDEQTILSAAELLRMVQGGLVGKRFVRLSETEFIALSERLAKQLARIGQLAHISKNSVVIPRYEIGLLGELISNPDTILREDKGVKELMRKIERAGQMAIAVPQGLQATLRDYQEDGYRWMMRLAEWGAGACLADDMGLGKTVQTIAVLLAKADKGASLVVAPASVLYNWQSELQRFAPTLSVHVLNEAEDRQAMIRSVQAYDVLLTTYGLLVREEKALTEKHWNVVCLDEAHTIKNRATKMSQAAMCLQADVRIALTGTPLQNYLSELWNLFQFINPGLLGSYETFTHEFINPIEAEHNKQRQVLLRRILQPFLLRRTKAEVIDELPDKTEITRRIELNADERVAYEAMRIEAQQQIAQAEKVDMNVLAAITRLRQAACSLELVQGASLSGDGGSKLADFAELIQQIVTGGNRVLVFSQFTSFLKMAQNSIGKTVSSFYLDGATPLAKRKQMVEQFQHGEAQVFFISLKAGGLGLNLTGANYVIHLDPWWNPAIEQQATDRAYRLGQKRNVTVYHLIAADTIEEKILRLHKTKRDLADALLQDQNATHALTLADLRNLIAINTPSAESE